MEIKPFTRKINYYETDRMGVTHHSNYIRFMEEARVDFLEQIGWGYDKMEAAGIISPVIGVNCRYKESTTFCDEIRIRIKVKEFGGVKLVLEYEMTKADNGHVVLTGTTEHCFLDTEGHPLRMKKEYPELYRTICEQMG